MSTQCDCWPAEVVVVIRRPVTVLDVVPEPAEGWDLRARCRGYDPAGFYADESAEDPGERTYYGALAWRFICPGCPVRAECLAHGLRTREEFGVWGGLPPPARRHLLQFLLEGLIEWDSVAPTLAPKA